MHDDHQSKIEAAVSECLRRCEGNALRFTMIAKFVEALKADGSWTEAEIAELQTSVMREILKHSRS